MLMILGFMVTSAVVFWILSLWSDVISITMPSIAAYLELHGAKEKLAMYELQKQIICQKVRKNIEVIYRCCPMQPLSYILEKGGEAANSDKKT
jgi:uncharacterized protein YqhQ